jgi:hypothetical protein
MKHFFMFNPLYLIVSNTADEDNLFPYNFPCKSSENQTLDIMTGVSPASLQDDRFSVQYALSSKARLYAYNDLLIIDQKTRH